MSRIVTNVYNIAITKEDVRRAMNNLGVPNENEARGMSFRQKYSDMRV